MTLRLMTMSMAAVLALLALIVFGTAIKAQPSADKLPRLKAPERSTTFELKPEADSDYVFDEVKVTKQENVIEQEGAAAKRKDAEKSDDGILIEAREKGTHKSDPEGYSLQVDLKKKTYDAVKMKKAQLQSVIQEQSKALGTSRETLSTESISTASSSYLRVVGMITRDPPGYKLTQSEHALRWTYGPRYVARGKFARGYTTPPGTHWYVSYNRFRGLRYIDGGRTLESKHDAAFYNYDFGYPNVATIVRHRTTIEGYRRGGWRYYWRWNASGEGYQLLTPQVYTYGG